MHPIMKQYRKYKAIQCPKCGNVQASYSTDAFKCFKCRKIRFFIKQASGHNPTMVDIKILFHSDNPNDVVKFVQEYKIAKHTKR